MSQAKLVTTSARFLFGVLLMPLAGALAYNFFKLMVELGRHASLSAVPFWLGLGSYFVFQALFSRPLRTYVFGHELTHALVGVLSGARLKSFKVSASGGSVVLTRAGILITLSPYFVPLYTVIIIAVYRAGSFFWPLEPYYPYVLFLCGFTLSFHFALTQYALGQGQSDMRQFGVFFSSVFIALVNFIFLSALLKLLFPGQVLLKPFFLNSIRHMVFFWNIATDKTIKLWYFFTQTR